MSSDLPACIAAQALTDISSSFVAASTWLRHLPEEGQVAYFKVVVPLMTDAAHALSKSASTEASTAVITKLAEKIAHVTDMEVKAVKEGFRAKPKDKPKGEPKEPQAKPKSKEKEAKTAEAKETAKRKRPSTPTPGEEYDGSSSPKYEPTSPKYEPTSPKGFDAEFPPVKVGAGQPLKDAAQLLSPKAKKAKAGPKTKGKGAPKLLGSPKAAPTGLGLSKPKPKPKPKSKPPAKPHAVGLATKAARTDHPAVPAPEPAEVFTQEPLDVALDLTDD